MFAVEPVDKLQEHGRLIDRDMADVPYEIRKNESGACPRGKMIKTQEECKKAANSLGRKYAGTDQYENKPIGCFVNSKGGDPMDKKFEIECNVIEEAKNNDKEAMICKLGENTPTNTDQKSTTTTKSSTTIENRCPGPNVDLKKVTFEPAFEEKISNKGSNENRVFEHVDRKKYVGGCSLVKIDWDGPPGKYKYHLIAFIPQMPKTKTMFDKDPAFKIQLV
jgi:hypothetical protein